MYFLCSPGFLSLELLDDAMIGSIYDTENINTIISIYRLNVFSVYEIENEADSLHEMVIADQMSVENNQHSVIDIEVLYVELCMER